jgi:hypothetical protein
VLERHHASEAFTVLREPSTAILSGLSKSDYTTARKQVSSGVPSTVVAGFQ